MDEFNLSAHMIVDILKKVKIVEFFSYFVIEPPIGKMNKFIFYFFINTGIQRVAVNSNNIWQPRPILPQCGDITQPEVNCSKLDIQANVCQPQVKSGQFLAFYGQNLIISH